MGTDSLSPYIFHQMNHRRIKIPYPVQFKIIVFMPVFNDAFSKPFNHSRFHPFTLKFRHDPEQLSQGNFDFFYFQMVHKSQYPPHIHFPIQVSYSLIYFRKHQKETNGFILIKSKINQFLINNRPETPIQGFHLFAGNSVHSMHFQVPGFIIHSKASMAFCLPISP